MGLEDTGRQMTVDSVKNAQNIYSEESSHSALIPSLAPLD